MQERRFAATWMVVTLTGAVAALVLHREPEGPFDAVDATACASAIADRLGYALGAPTAAADGGSWTVTAMGEGFELRLVVRSLDRRITDVAVERGGGADVLTREERLVALEAGCD